MAKKQVIQTNDEYILTDISERHSSLNGGKYWRMTWLGVDDQKYYESTVDATYANFKKQGWDKIVNDDEYYGVYRGLKNIDRTTKAGVPVVSADSQVNKTQNLEEHEVRLLEEAMKEQARTPHDESLWGNGLFAWEGK